MFKINPSCLNLSKTKTKINFTTVTSGEIMNLRAEGGTDIQAALMAGIDTSSNVLEMSSKFSDVIMVRS